MARSGRKGATATAPPRATTSAPVGGSRPVGAAPPGDGVPTRTAPAGPVRAAPAGSARTAGRGPAAGIGSPIYEELVAELGDPVGRAG